MAEDMTIEEYLAGGGRLTSPGNVPPRYRAELLRMMASFVDSELAGAAGFAEIVNDAPGVTERIASAKIVMEKFDHAGRVLRLMGEFGADTGRYARHHPWTDRLAREAEVGTARANPDMRLAVFNYPLAGWADAVVMNLLMGLAAGVQIEELGRVSYQPLAETMRGIAPVEANHVKLAREGIAALAARGEAAGLQASVDYWWPRVATSFGSEDSRRVGQLQRLGLRHAANAELSARWQDAARDALSALGLAAPR